MIADNLRRVHERIASACDRAGRDVQSITLLAVSKTFDADTLREAVSAGQCAFGENYVQEAVAKVDTLADLRGRLAWHFIGPLQANKTRVVAERFDWVHTVDRLKIAERLSAQRPAALPPLQVCIQVNVDGEATKGGVEPAGLPELARAVAALPNLALRGLMSIPAPASGDDAQRRPHRLLREWLDRLRARGLALDTLSMGMSADLEAAIAEGATIVRAGSAVFGARAAAAGISA